jgi:hypothetical protein
VFSREWLETLTSKAEEISCLLEFPGVKPIIIVEGGKGMHQSTIRMFEGA